MTTQYGSFGIVTPEQAALYMPGAYERARREWPWLGVINYWFFKQADDSRRDQAWYYFRMVEPDFTPLPIYEAMRAHIAGDPRVLYAGTHQAETFAVDASGGSALVEVDGAQFGQSLHAVGLSFRAHGTHILLRWRGTGALNVEVNGTVRTLDAIPTGADGWRWTELVSADDSRLWSVQVSSADASLDFDSILILDRSTEHALLLAAAGLIVLAVFGHALLSGWRDRHAR